MILTLSNIGKIKDATVELNGITVIAGENNTGKSTVGKVLYSVFNSFYKFEEQIFDERLKSIERILDIFYRNITNRLTSRVDTEEMAHYILKNSTIYKENFQLMVQYIIDSFIQYDNNFKKYDMSNDRVKNELKRISEIIKISDEEIFRTVLTKKLDFEFNGQVNNIFTGHKSRVNLQIKDRVVSIFISNNAVQSVKNQFHLNTEAIYIDDPFVLDDPRMVVFRYGSGGSHREQLKAKLFLNETENNIISEIITTNRLDSIYTKLNTICSGEIIFNKRSLGYRKDGTDKVLDIKNISTGLKTFMILKTLLQNGEIEENGTIILDEPEIHLHPEWQLLFAELIVLIQKEFNLHILLNTHSLYFLNAIEVYAVKYGIGSKCKYYLASVSGDVSHIEDVSNNVEKIYAKLASPLQDLENERYKHDSYREL